MERPVRFYKYWDVALGGKAIRVSMHNARGDEYYAVISGEGARGEVKEAKANAVHKIEMAIINGRDPGGVPVND